MDSSQTFYLFSNKLLLCKSYVSLMISCCFCRHNVHIYENSKKVPEKLAINFVWKQQEFRTKKFTCLSWSYSMINMHPHNCSIYRKFYKKKNHEFDWDIIAKITKLHRYKNVFLINVFFNHTLKITCSISVCSFV